MTREAREAFVREHLAGFAGSLARRLAADDAGYLAAAAQVLAALVPAVDDRATGADADPFAEGCGDCAGPGAAGGPR